MTPSNRQERPWDDAAAEAAIRPHAVVRGGLLPALHALQDLFGYVDGRAVALLASAFRLSRADVHGVITFYHDFRHEPAARHVVKLCRAEACQAMGCRTLEADLVRQLGVAMGETGARVTLEPVYCLGLCATGPAAIVDDRLMGRATAARIVAALDDAA